jgi:hypothetical protein
VSKSGENNMTNIIEENKAITWIKTIKQKSLFLQYICSDITDKYYEYIKENNINFININQQVK